MKAYTTLFAVISLSISPVFASYHYTAGHADIGLGEGGRLELHLHAHAGAVINGVSLLDDAEYEPGDVVIVVPNTTLFQRQQDAIWDFLGNGPDQNTWQLPQSRTDAVPYLGIGAEEVSLDVFLDNVLTLTLIAVDGPGHFSLYRTSAGTPIVSMASGDGISEQDSIQVEAGRHRHFNFAFTAPGEYTITFEVSGVHLEHGPMTEQAVFTFHVIPEPASLLLLLPGIIGVVRRKK